MVQKVGKKNQTTGIPSDAAGEIRFYRANEKPYGPFSNLYKCAVTLPRYQWLGSRLQIKTERSGAT
jgi:hypothetical protein